MNRHVNAIAGRLSLRPPQRDSLEILHRVTEILPPRKDADVAAALESIRREFPEVEDFERDFPSLCFALATGVGKTRLMGAFISYLHLAHGINNFFVLAPNLTIYRKLIADFTPNTPKYVFRGIAEFATDPPEVITGEDYEAKVGTLFDQLIRCKVNIFSISKINSEVRGGKAPRIKRLSEYIGESYFEYLSPTALFEPPMTGLMEPLAGPENGSRTGRSFRGFWGSSQPLISAPPGRAAAPGS
jgi:type III restriction enzyme